jgi:hypothetical protein
MPNQTLAKHAMLLATVAVELLTLNAQVAKAEHI